MLRTIVLLIVFAGWNTANGLSASKDWNTYGDRELSGHHFEGEKQDKENIKIGLLLPASPANDVLSKSALQGAEMAIMQANEAGGYNGCQFELVSRTTDGLWGAGSKESVELVYTDQVVAIVTAVDGRNAHLAEQVAAKSHVVQVGTRATEETLSQAYVPWFFRIVPNDVQQSEALIEEIFVHQRLTNAYILQEDNYDATNAAESFKKIAGRQGFRISGTSSLTEEVDIFKPEVMNGMDALVVFGTFEVARPILDKLKGAYPSLQVFGVLSMTSDGQIGAGYSEGCEGGIFVSSKFCFTTPGQAFKDSYLNTYDQMPNPAASYAYDGMNLIIEAVRQAGPDRQKIREVLKDIDYQKAATGPIRFDAKGNRISPVFLIRLIKGHPVILNP